MPGSSFTISMPLIDVYPDQLVADLFVGSCERVLQKHLGNVNGAQKASTGIVMALLECSIQKDPNRSTAILRLQKVITKELLSSGVAKSRVSHVTTLLMKYLGLEEEKGQKLHETTEKAIEAITMRTVTRILDGGHETVPPLWILKQESSYALRICTNVQKTHLEWYVTHSLTSTVLADAWEVVLVKALGPDLSKKALKRDFCNVMIGFFKECLSSSFQKKGGHQERLLDALKAVFGSLKVAQRVLDVIKKSFYKKSFLAPQSLDLSGKTYDYDFQAHLKRYIESLTANDPGWWSLF